MIDPFFSGAMPVQDRITGEYFESVTEGAWGAYFRSVGIAYEREPETFLLPTWGKYTPDFWLPDHDCFVETKKGNIDEEATGKARTLAYRSGKAILLINQRPHNFAMFLYGPHNIHPHGNTKFWGADFRFSSDGLRPGLDGKLGPAIKHALHMGQVAAHAATHNHGLVKARPEAIEAADKRREALRAYPTLFPEPEQMEEFFAALATV